ncbi:cell surface protein [Pyxidicoccus xibeiensis]|uniref:cell surface protein n=1 Tax=Pyxidicoccus xibeiensis TaxID=2906759 RepID=UPI0020A7FB33|nr:cell surface protein [Pyxidicoccus xibeiensis]MCP3139344.1 cell surface protein [Pyxidicoccus xibeiensis]
MSSRGSSLLLRGAALAVLVALSACGDETEAPATPDAGPGTDAGTPDSGTDAGSRPADPYADAVVSFAPGEGAGFGQDLFPGVVLGPPTGAGPDNGSLDVLSLGRGGSITLRFDDVGLVDGPGVDLLVFENAFALPGGATYTETGRVSVSEDGVTFHDFACASTDAAGGYPGCAGVRTVQANPANGVSATDPAVAGGDSFDLATVGLTRARYVRITDSGNNRYGDTAGGFDLDAVAVVNGESLQRPSP